VHGARTAQGHPAAVFRAGQAEVFPQDPQERRVGPDVQDVPFPVDEELDHPILPIPILIRFAAMLVESPESAAAPGVG
jgi:hypothetical protein